MKKVSLVLCVMGVFVFLCLASPGYAALYSGAWYQSDRDNWFAIELTSGVENSDYSFGIYDWQNTGSSLEVVTDGVFDSQSVWVWEDSGTGTWYAGLSDGATDLTLGDSALFGFYFFDGTDTVYEYDMNGSESNWVLDGLPGFSVSVSDVKPVPLPANVVLLGSGLLCLVAIARKR